jgi:methyl-accepting chemotaxis protein
MTDGGEKPKRRFMRLLRRGGREPVSPQEALEASALWVAHQKAAAALREAGEAAQRIGAHLAKQRSVAETAADRARGVAARSAEIESAFGRLKDTFARLELVALNAGLEGARFGEGPGQALNLVADEVRAQASRGTQACSELGTALGEFGGELAQVHASFDRVRDASADVARESAAFGGATAAAERALAEMGERLSKTTGSDPETARALTEATEAASKLAAAFQELRGKTPQALLRPILEPLVRLLESDRDDQPER